MINANMMYLRPGNLFKEFVIENNRQKVTSTGRVVNDHKGDGVKTLYGCLADATTETAKNKSTEDHTVTHTIVQRGIPLAKKTDKLVLENRVIPAAVKAVERVDSLVGDAVQAIKDVDGVLFICADHGNAEQLKDYETGVPFTAHTTNPVPFILVNAEEGLKLREGGCLADIVPTLIELMGMEQPAEMTGKSLIVK